jgi:vacuolar-type H+-ATPase subunit F/Vma7
MSRLLIITHPSLVAGFQIAGVEAVGAEDPDTAAEIALEMIAEQESGLLAIDSSLLENMDRGMRERLQSAKHLPILAIPGGEPLGMGASRRARIVEMIRQAIGFHMTFKRRTDEVEEE